MKPKINDEIWCIYDTQIIKEKVEYLGEDSFLIEGYACKYDPCYSYSDYNVTWFKDLEKAKKQMRKTFGKNIKIVDLRGGWLWEVEDDD